MNNRGQKTGIGILIVLFIGAIVGLVLLQTTAQETDDALTTRFLANRTITAPAAGSTTDLVGQELLSTPIVTNASGGGVVPTTNYTIAEGVSTVDGLKRIRYTTVGPSPFASKSVNVSYTYGPEGYIEDSAGRSIFSLVIILGALALAVFLLIPSLRETLDNLR